MFGSKATTNTLAMIGFLAILFLLFYLLSFVSRHIPQSIRNSAALIYSNQGEESPLRLGDSWIYTFNVEGVLHEASQPELSSSPYWWLSSGGMLLIKDGRGQTISKALPEGEEWHWRYERNNPLDTDGGRYPQNLFRLLTKHVVDNAVISGVFTITAINLTDTPNRDGYSGLFLVSRYQDSNNLYYAGIRQDGHAVIKKKLNGEYTTLAEKPFFVSLRPYERNTNPNFLPGQKPVGLRLVTVTKDDAVTLELQIDRENNGQWEGALSVVDENTNGPALTAPGRVGIRTDFMDVKFDNFSIEPLK